MKVTVIIPTLGCLEVISQCLPTWFPLPLDWEVIIADSRDSVRDGSNEWLADFANRNGARYIRYDSNPPNNVKLDPMIRECKSEWVFALDSDAELKDASFFERIESALDDPQNAVIGKTQMYKPGELLIKSPIGGKPLLMLPRAEAFAIFIRPEFFRRENISSEQIYFASSLIPSRWGSSPAFPGVLAEHKEIIIAGDGFWTAYWTAISRKCYREFSQDEISCLHHRGHSTCQWMQKHGVTLDP